MLSILIPTYNYNVYPLVTELKNQADALGIDYEILVQDDGSSSYLEENRKIYDLANCSFLENKENLGRSKVRNLLSSQAKYNWLLFLDSDTFPKNSDYILKYIQNISSKTGIIYGGIEYQNEEPEKNRILRWFYGKEREALSVNKRNKNKYLSFLTLNFLINKNVFKSVKFNENIPNLRHEDTLFSYDLFKKNISVEHIKNVVIHNGLDDNIVFLRKSKESIEGLLFLINNNLINSNYIKLSKYGRIITNLQLTFLLVFFLKIFGKKIERNLLSEKPNLFLFDFYRLCYFCLLQKKHSK
ncbi:glycosyltransferase family 2 protein [Flavobacterium helocola]|uniref:Glycosyltransferase n=1 Tax=Flavobacterium helocola TaxID=3139139 RepID=A0ABU9I7K4_9FLAO